jgi:hypothetical protein
MCHIKGQPLYKLKQIDLVRAIIRYESLHKIVERPILEKGYILGLHVDKDTSSRSSNTYKEASDYL